MLKEAFAGHPATRNIQLQHGMTDLLSDKLRGSVKTPTSSRHFKMGSAHVDCSELLREQAVRAGLVPSQPWLEKVEQLHTLTQLKHGQCILHDNSRHTFIATWTYYAIDSSMYMHAVKRIGLLRPTIPSVVYTYIIRSLRQQGVSGIAYIYQA